MDQRSSPKSDAALREVSRASPNNLPSTVHWFLSFLSYRKKEGFTVKEMAGDLGIPIASAHRLIHRLADLGWVKRVDVRRNPHTGKAINVWVKTMRVVPVEVRSRL